MQKNATSRSFSRGGWKNEISPSEQRAILMIQVHNLGTTRYHRVIRVIRFYTLNVELRLAARFGKLVSV